MTAFHLVKQNRPLRLNEEEQSNPNAVFEVFLRQGDPNYWRHVLWHWLGSQLTDGQIVFKSPAEDKITLMTVEHHQLAKIVEAAWLTHKEQNFYRLRFNEAEVERLMQNTMDLPSKPTFYEVKDRLYPFLFLTSDEHKAPMEVIQNTFLIYDLYDWQTILDEWLIYGTKKSLHMHLKNQYAILYIYVQLNKLAEAIFLLPYR